MNRPNFCHLQISPFQKICKIPLGLVTFRQKSSYLVKECPNFLKLILFLTYLDLVAVQENYILHYSILLLLYRIMDHLLGTEIDKRIRHWFEMIFLSKKVWQTVSKTRHSRKSIQTYNAQMINICFKKTWTNHRSDTVSTAVFPSFFETEVKSYN